MAGEPTLTQKAVMDWFLQGIAHDPGLTPIMLVVGTKNGKLGTVASPEWMRNMKKDSNFGSALRAAITLVLADKEDEMSEQADTR